MCGVAVELVHWFIASATLASAVELFPVVKVFPIVN